MKHPEPTRVIRGLLEVARPELLRLYEPDCCIANTRVAIDVLHHFGIDARPLKVRVVIANPTYLRLVGRHGPPPDQATMDGWVNREGAWTVGVGVESSGATGRKDTPGTANRWCGHLVAVTADRVLVDLSLDQASRPGRGIVLAPLAESCTVAFLEGSEPASFLQNGCLVHYAACPGDRSWSHSHDWARKRFERLTGAIIRRLEDRLSRPGSNPDDPEGPRCRAPPRRAAPLRAPAAPLHAVRPWRRHITARYWGNWALGRDEESPATRRHRRPRGHTPSQRRDAASGAAGGPGDDPGARRDGRGSESGHCPAARRGGIAR